MLHLLHDMLKHIPSITSFLLLVAIYLASVTISSFLRHRLLPPGPQPYPIIGNALQVPAKFAAIRFTQWSKEYGSIFSLNLLGQHIVVLNSHKTATDLLDRRSNIYSSRPRLVIADEIATEGLFLPFLRYGDLWRKHRRAAHESFNSKATEKLQPMQAQAAVQATLLTLAQPENWEQHIKRYSGSSVLRSVYGCQPLSLKSGITHITDRIHEFATRITVAAAPGAVYLVELIPLMKYLPVWLAPWKRKALEWSQQDIKMLEELNSGVAARMSAGDEQLEECLVTQLIKNEDHNLSESESALLAGAMFTAGSDAIATALQYFVLAMVLHPTVMQKAQAEIDACIGRDRPPTFEDASSLPYTRAIVRELLRWRPAAPLGMPHSTTEDDYYDRFFIPKGTTVIPNIWAMNRDTQFYPDFDEFRPERFLENSEEILAVLPYTHDMGHVSYGFGRRICVGMYFADQALFIMITMLLWAAKICPKLDERGIPIKPSASDLVDNGLVLAPAPFPCVIVPRFAEAEAVLQAALSEM